MSNFTGELTRKQNLTRDITHKQSLYGNIANRQHVNGETHTGKFPTGKSVETYQGVCELIPSEEEQVLTTAEKYMEQNIVIKPIPQNYGKVTYNQDKTLTIT